MIVHVCSHYGDIEVKPGSTEDEAVIEYTKLTPVERRVLREFLTHSKIEFNLVDTGRIVVPMSMWKVGDELARRSHGGERLVSAIRLVDGTVKVKRGGIMGFLAGLFGSPNTPALPEPWKAWKPPGAEPEAAVSTHLPKRGCPMPDPTEMREAKAASVVRKFLSPTQAADFDRSRAFVCSGDDTGHLYRVTSRWSPDVSRFGVLYDITDRHSICASDREVPPSEEALSMLFAVEHFERAFLDQPHG